MHFVAPPKNIKTFSWKTRFPILGTVACRFHGNYFVAPPKNGKTFSRKTRLPILGTVAQMFSGFWRQNVHFLAWSFWYFYFYIFYVSIYDVVHHGPKKFRKLPSNARFFPKRFRHVHFWTYFSCLIPEIFLTLVQSKNKNNKFNLCNN